MDSPKPPTFLHAPFNALSAYPNWDLASKRVRDGDLNSAWAWSDDCRLLEITQGGVVE